MKLYTVPKFRTALTVITVDGAERVIGNSLDVAMLLLGSAGEEYFEGAQRDLYQARPELFWNMDETIEQDGETTEDFVGHTPREIIGKLAERLV